MHRIRIKRGLVALLALILVATAGISALSVAAAPDEGGRVPYQFRIDDLNGKDVGGTMIGVIRDLHLPLGESIVAKGWMATPEGVSAYQYLWVPSGGGNAEWKPVEAARIIPRGDLASAGVSHPSGHGTAGFELTLTPPSDLAEGTYDVYIRAIDGMGLPCDMVAILNLRYGDPDADDGKQREISFSRILREGESAWAGNVTVTSEGAVISEEGRFRLGELNLAAYGCMRITYTASNAADGVGEGRKPILGLKSSGKHGYGTAGQAYNLTDDLVYAPIDSVTEAGTVEIDLTDVNYCGDVWLTGYLGGEVTVTAVEFIYHGYMTDRVAAKIYLSGDLVGYFAGANRTEVRGITDPVLGDVIRMEVTEETNDPYVHFNAGRLLEENGIKLDADEYKYMVLLYRAESVNNSDRMNLYLCSGPITGATEACNQGVHLQKDGKWHYLLIDLSQKENWGGIINGWRFDYISANSDAGDAVEFATVQFFRTAEGARKAASQNPAKQTPYKSGDPVIFRDMSEESNTEKEIYVIPDEDSYVVTEAETNPSVSPETTPTTGADDPDSPTDVTTDSEETNDSAEPGGCSSTCAPLAVILALPAAIPLIRKQYKRKGEIS